MIYTPMTMKALSIAYAAHHGQLDQAGLPYIHHPLHLAEAMADELTCTVALLHDVVEDTAVTLEELAKEFPAEVVEAVDLLTHKDGVDYFDYVRAIRTNHTAAMVKLADLTHNGDQSRCIGTDISPEKMAAWREKYAKRTTVRNTSICSTPTAVPPASSFSVELPPPTKNTACWSTPVFSTPKMRC